MTVVREHASVTHPIVAPVGSLPRRPWWWRTPVVGALTSRPVWMSCPRGHVGRLDNHTVAGDGTVDPSVQCPEDGCDFHDHVRLEGWTP